MNKHSEKDIELVECPFAVEINTINWELVKKIVSTDDIKNSVIVEMNNESRFIVNIPAILYNAVYKSGENNVIEQDFGFNELT